ncbi:hypothetical protein JCM5353_002371 [Sporobolomyces roseus]
MANEGRWRRTRGWGQPYNKLIKPLIEELPNLKVVTISNLLEFSEVDEAVCLAQKRRWNGREADHESLPMFKLDEGRQVSGSPSAVYHGYKCPELIYSSAGWESTMEASHNTLRSVSVILHHSTDLSSFRRLERLTLELSGIPMYPPYPTGVDNILLQLLSQRSSPSLRVLVLRSYISPNELSNLLRNGTLAATLPPSLTHLSIFISANPSDVLIFIRSLPNATHLDRFNYWGEEGEAEEVRRACKERGIRLSLKQRWKIWCVWYPDRTRDLARCCRTSKTFFAYAQPLLYRSIHLDQRVEVDRDNDVTRLGVRWWTKRLLSILQDNPRVCELVEEVVMHGGEGACFDDDDEDEDDHCLLWDVIDLFPALRTVELRNLAQFSRMDEIVELAQAEINQDDDRTTTPVFRLVSEEDDEDHLRIGSFGGAYEGYKRESDYTCHEGGWEEMLECSMDTLTRLEIPFDHSTSLFGFKHLKQLTLRLPDGQHSYHGILAGYGDNLLRHLSALVSLRCLVLVINSASPDHFVNLLRTENLADSLPPNLLYLSLETPLDISDVQAFIRHLSVTTTLQVFNYWGKRDEREEIETHTSINAAAHASYLSQFQQKRFISGRLLLQPNHSGASLKHQHTRYTPSQRPPAFDMVPFLPNEVIHLILSYVQDSRHQPQDLARCALSSKTLLAFAQPLLYTDIGTYVSIATDTRTWDRQFHFDKKIFKLLKCLRRHPKLGDLVKKITFEGLDYGKWKKRGGDKPSDVFGPLIELLDARTVILLRNLVQFSRIDLAISSAQKRWTADNDKTGPLIRVLGLGDGMDSELKGQYEGYDSEIYHSGVVKWRRILEYSEHSLKRLYIPFGVDTSIYYFQQLESLSLCFPDYPPADPFPNLLLFNLSALQSLRLLILAQPDSRNQLKTLTEGFTEAIPFFLPDSITHLSLDLRPRPANILLFLDAHSRTKTKTSRLKRLNYMAEEGKEGGHGLEGQVELECRKKGIKSSVNEKWEIWW